MHPDLEEQLTLVVRKTVNFLCKEHENPFFSDIELPKFIFNTSFSVCISVLKSLDNPEMTIKILERAFNNAIKELKDEIDERDREDTEE